MTSFLHNKKNTQTIVFICKKNKKENPYSYVNLALKYNIFGGQFFLCDSPITDLRFSILIW